MNTEEFDIIIKARIDNCLSVLGKKKKEYARGDRLSNLKKVAAFQGSIPEKVLWGMAMKHIASIDDFIADHEKGMVHTQEEWSEKIGDSINYLLLLDAILNEKEI